MNGIARVGIWLQAVFAIEATERLPNMRLEPAAYGPDRRDHECRGSMAER